MYLEETISILLCLCKITELLEKQHQVSPLSILCVLICELSKELW